MKRLILSLALLVTLGQSCWAMKLGVPSLPGVTPNSAGGPGVVFSPSLSSFTVSGVISTTFAGTASAPCVAGSTISLTFPAGVTNAYVQFQGAMRNGNLAAKTIIGILVDGAFVNGETTTKGLTTMMQDVATDNTDMQFSTILTGLAAGSHTVCMTGWVSAGTTTIDNTDSVATLTMYMLP